MEFVFVVPRESLFPDCYPHGLLSFGEEGFEREAFETRAQEAGFFVEREYAERTPSLKQIIPYALVCSGQEVLLVRRLRQGGEARLHDKLSIGIGGHINPVDAGHSELGLFEAASQRELLEELHIDGPTRSETWGILNDDSNPVGAVHVGLVQVVHVRGSVRIREEHQLQGELTSVDGLRAAAREGGAFETWSQLLLDRIDELFPHPVPTLT